MCACVPHCPCKADLCGRQWPPTCGWRGVQEPHTGRWCRIPASPALEARRHITNHQVYTAATAPRTTLTVYVAVMASTPAERFGVGLEVPEGYAVGAADPPVAALDPHSYSASVQEAKERGRQLRSSNIFNVDDPWAAEAAAGGGKGGYMAPLSQRDKDIIAAETASARARPEEKLAQQIARQGECLDETIGLSCVPRWRFACGVCCMLVAVIDVDLRAQRKCGHTTRRVKQLSRCHHPSHLLVPMLLHLHQGAS